MSNSRMLSDDEVETLAGKLSVVMSSSDHTLDLTKLTPADFKAVAAKAMERIDLGQPALTDEAKKSPTIQDTLKTTGPTLGRPSTCDSDRMTDK
jgi:hypothetical protein